MKYHDEGIREAYRTIEKQAEERLLSMLPDDLRPAFAPHLGESGEEYGPYIKAADKLSALIKCIEEQKAGNREFDEAAKTILKHPSLAMPEAQTFCGSICRPTACRSMRWNDTLFRGIDVKTYFHVIEGIEAFPSENSKDFTQIQRFLINLSKTLAKNGISAYNNIKHRMICPLANHVCYLSNKLAGERNGKSNGKLSCSNQQSFDG